jgi:hypothetical protein
MRHHTTLTRASLFSILLLSFHLADDVVRGFEPGKLSTMIGVGLLAVWLYATVALAERRPRYVILLLFSFLASGVPVIHMTGAGLVGGRIANSSGMFFWVWTHIALGVTAIVSVMLSARALWAAPSSDRLAT